MKVFSVINEKGGVSKTSLSANIAYGLASKYKQRVLLVDADPQHNLSSMMIKRNEKDELVKLDEFLERLPDEIGIDKAIEELNGFLNYAIEKENSLDLSDVLYKPVSIHEAIVGTKYENVDIVPASHKLSVTDYYLKNERNGYRRLMIALNEVRNEYDVVIIDNSPFSTAITCNAIMACHNEGDRLIIPTKVDYETWEGLNSTLNNLIAWIQDEGLDCDVSIVRTFVTRTKTTEVGSRILEKLFGDRLLNSSIRFQSSPIQASSFDNSVLLASTSSIIKKSGVFNDYTDLADEIFTKYIKC